jgi:DNA-binding HxlR family transcriptional regulator
VKDYMDMPDWCETEEWCPVTVTAELLGRKWHPVIVHRLLEGGKGFNQLQRECHGISSKVLDESLKELMENNVVEKETVSTSPKEVEYSLTERGRSLEPVIREMKDWAEDHSDEF